MAPYSVSTRKVKKSWQTPSFEKIELQTKSGIKSLAGLKLLDPDAINY
ncbi:hypothetical protein [Emticicia sp. 21SJ11W-3]|nr:hypothetical protein [Emticicia sp. 21SJ11W-3]UTA67231.1 hypothetical protein MB380_16680 [Emticicia sp. 21SJ11W-3]